MDITDSWPQIIAHTETSIIPGNLTTYPSKPFLSLKTREVKHLKSLNLKNALSDFGKNKYGKLCFLTLSINSKSINSLIGIESYNLIEKLSLQDNELSDVGLLVHLPNLYSIDISRNFICTIENMLPNRFLVFLNLSQNHLTSFPDIALFPHLIELNLSGNKIGVLKNSAKNRNLRSLSISNNQINSFQFCEQFSNLRILDISFCDFNDFEETGKFLGLETLKANSNNISTLKSMQNLKGLISLDFSQNQIRDLSEIYNLQDLEFLKSLNLNGNQCQSINFYLYLMVYSLPQLLVLDENKVTTNNKTETEVFFGKDVEARKAIFDRFLPQETFVDYRIYKIENVVVHKDCIDDFEEGGFECFDFSIV